EAFACGRYDPARMFVRSRFSPAGADNIDGLLRVPHGEEGAGFSKNRIQLSWKALFLAPELVKSHGIRMPGCEIAARPHGERTFLRGRRLERSPDIRRTAGPHQRQDAVLENLVISG